MKKIFNYTVLLLSAFLLTLTGCKQQELVFDHELQQWESKADAILLEFIAPAGSAADEQIYITGEFNKGEKYFLEKTKNDKKWAIYLYQSDFTAEGKTLKDGFTFGSMKNGLLCDFQGKVDTLTTDITYGQWTNLWGSRWESYFKHEDDPDPIVPGQYEHLYVIGNVEGVGWKPAEPLELTMVGTDIFRGEITFVADGSNAICYFAVLTEKGKDNDDWGTVNAARWGNDNAELTEGNVVDLKLQESGDQNVTIAPGTYTITVNMVEKQIVIGNGDWDKPAKKDKYEHLYVLGNIEGTGWKPAEPIEMTKVGHDLFRAELTFVPDGSNTICYFAFATEKGKDNDDWTTLNAARWGGGELKEGEYVPLTLQTTSDVTCTIAPGTYTITVNMIFNEATIGEGDWSGRPEPTPDPTPDPQPGTVDTVLVHDTITTHLYFVDETTDMDYVYTHGGGEVFGGWPGANWTEWKTVTFLGQKFYCYEFKAVSGFVVNGIINNNAGKQIEPAFAFTVSGDQTDFFYTIGDDAVTEIKPEEDVVSEIRSLLY